MGVLCISAGNLHSEMRDRRDKTFAAILQQVLHKSKTVNDNVCMRCEKMTLELNKVGSA